MDGTIFCQQDLAYKNIKIKEYMNQLISKNDNQKCDCCPYGYHVSLDFVEFAKDIFDSHDDLQKIGRCQRTLERVHNDISHCKDGMDKEAFSMKQALVHELTCSSSDSTSNVSKHTDINDNDTIALIKEIRNDVPLITNSADDGTSRSSDDSVLRSPSNNSDLNNSNVANIFRGVTLPEDHYRRCSSSSKSFVVSYEHLMSIREQMSASLRRVQDLETEANECRELRHKVDSLTLDNQRLQRQLTDQATINSSRLELHRRIITEAEQWRHISDLPANLLTNLERVLHQKLPPAGKSEDTPRSEKSRSVQTDVSGSLIVDTLSYLTHFTKGPQNPSYSEISPKIHRRNFGVTVRPTHNHFTQQISFSSKSFKPDESLSKFLNWIKISHDDMDKKIGLILYNLLGYYFKNLYKGAVDLLKEEFVALSYDQKAGQCHSDVATQVSDRESCDHKTVQAQPAYWHKYTNTLHLEFTNASIGTEKNLVEDSTSQTANRSCHRRGTQTTAHISNKDFVCQYQHKTRMSSISSNTDRVLIDELIAEQIEKSMYLIQQELQVEMEARIPSSAEENKGNSIYQLELPTTTILQPNEIHQELSGQVRGFEVPVENVFMESNNTNASEEVSASFRHGLVRSKIKYWNFTDEEGKDCNNNMNPSPSFGGVNSVQTIDTELRNAFAFVEETTSENSNSTGSSPMEGCYYTTDSRIDHREINKINEDDEAADEEESVKTIEDKRCSSTDKVLMIGSNTMRLEFPESVKEACNIVAIWMNDSTTTCSKDLNESFGIIRQFWFGVTRNNCSSLKFYLDKFKSFNPVLQERVINMTDTSGNTCLHYAVSEGGWPIVRQLLETEQADVSKTNKAGYTSLMLAAVSDVLDEETLKLLISKSEVDKQSKNDAQQTALMIAASQGKGQLVNLLLEAGSSVNVTDSDGSSALMCACDNGHLEVVRLLLSRSDIDTELEDKMGSSAMQIALDNSHKDVALLIFARNNLQRGSLRSKRRSGTSSQ